MLHMRNCDTKATSPIFWEKEQNSVKDIGSSNLGRPFLGDQRTLNVPHRCHCLSNQIFLFSLNRSFGLGDIFCLI